MIARVSNEPKRATAAENFWQTGVLRTFLDCAIWQSLAGWSVFGALSDRSLGFEIAGSALNGRVFTELMRTLATVGAEMRIFGKAKSDKRAAETVSLRPACSNRLAFLVLCSGFAVFSAANSSESH